MLIISDIVTNDQVIVGTVKVNHSSAVPCTSGQAELWL